jgi:hypothetical protein
VPPAARRKAHRDVRRTGVLQARVEEASAAFTGEWDGYRLLLLHSTGAKTARLHVFLVGAEHADLSVLDLELEAEHRFA